ncbi:MAG: SDR family oxidoreductase [Planctomycetota bacterium]|nr:SDR family oxidoreductase [Planctomycetota bacterium]
MQLSRRDVVAATGLLAAPLVLGLQSARGQQAPARGTVLGQPGRMPGRDAMGPERAREGDVSQLDPARDGKLDADRVSSEAHEAAKLKNPTEMHPKPPFRKQPQEWPGLASRMTPVPDHGEQSYRGSGKLIGRKALITGGDSGIGRAAAIAFAREGADVCINYLPFEESDASEVVQLIEAEGRRAITIPGDIRREEFCKQLVDQAVEGLGGLDILVNNAGQQVYRESITEVSTEQMDSTFHTNVYAMVWITKAAMKHLKPGASIIVTTSIQAYDPSPHILDYAMTKACNAIFVRGLSKELAPKGIRINGVAPGPIWTPLQPSGGMSQDRLVTFGQDAKLGRPGQPAELAATYVLLASNDSSYVSGEIHGVTGGNPTA